MKTRFFSILMALALLAITLGGATPAQAMSGTGTVTCEGDGVVTFEGEVKRIEVSGTGSVVYNKRGGTIWTEGTAWQIYHAYTSDGKRVTILIGWGEAYGRNIADAHVILSAANGYLQVSGSGTLYARGEGYCETESGVRYEWTTTGEGAVIAVEE